jgi:hypothetical protein
MRTLNSDARQSILSSSSSKERILPSTVQSRMSEFATESTIFQAPSGGGGGGVTYRPFLPEKEGQRKKKGKGGGGSEKGDVTHFVMY